MIMRLYGERYEEKLELIEGLKAELKVAELKIDRLEASLRTIGELAERATVHRDPMIAFDVAQIARDAVTPPPESWDEVPWRDEGAFKL